MNFCTNEEDDKKFIRNIEYIRFEISDGILKISLKGDGFLRYMVRMIVGVLVEIGLERKNISFIKERLDNDEFNRSNYKIKHEGLYLKEIIYES